MSNTRKYKHRKKLIFIAAYFCCHQDLFLDVSLVIVFSAHHLNNFISILKPSLLIFELQLFKSFFERLFPSLIDSYFKFCLHSLMLCHEYSTRYYMTVQGFSPWLMSLWRKSIGFLHHLTCSSCSILSKCYSYTK